MKEIKLNRNIHTDHTHFLIDDEDFGLISGFKWSVHKNTNGNISIDTSIRVESGIKTLKAHRLIMNAKREKKSIIKITIILIIEKKI